MCSSIIISQYCIAYICKIIRKDPKRLVSHYFFISILRPTSTDQYYCWSLIVVFRKSKCAGQIKRILQIHKFYFFNIVVKRWFRILWSLGFIILLSLFIKGHVFDDSSLLKNSCNGIRIINPFKNESDVFHFNF